MNQSHDPPLLFISHKHDDSKIADVIRAFITTYSGGRVHVHQSSSAWADAPRTGRNLNKQLKDALWRTTVVILIYTDQEHDWAYCMWECGVASHPQSPETKIIVLQCANSVPALFAEQVNINARSLVDIQKFVNDALTTPDFFSGVRVTDFPSSGQEVASAAADFSQKLIPVLPEIESPIDWPAHPFLQLKLDIEHTNKLRGLLHPDRVQLVHDEAIIVNADAHCAQVFGMPSMPHGMTFKQLTYQWKERCPEAKPDWIEALVIQIVACGMWEFPPTNWKQMEGANAPACYAPIVTRVRKLPERQCMQFDIYFYAWPGA